MKLKWLSYSLLLPIGVLTPICVTSCNSTKSSKLVAIPTVYLNLLENNTILDGILPDKLETILDGYDTLQVPSSVITVKGFVYRTTYRSYDSIKTITYSSSSKWEKIQQGAFSRLPNLTTLILPNSLKTIESSAFVDLFKLNTIDVSNIDNVKTLLISDAFDATDPQETCVLNGTFICKDDNQINDLKEIFKSNDWLKKWSYKISK